MTDTEEPTGFQLRQSANAIRRRFEASPLSRFARKMQEVIRDYLVARAQGVSRDDAVRGIEEVLRAEWPHRPTRFPPACGACDDSGWQLRSCCAEMRCGRRLCSERDATWVHAYVVRCACEKGQQALAQARTADEELAAAGRTKKARGFTRWGRP